MFLYIIFPPIIVVNDKILLISKTHKNTKWRTSLGETYKGRRVNYPECTIRKLLSKQY